MSTPADDLQAEDVVAALGRFPDGATLKEIEQSLPPATAGTKLQYRLMKLVREGRIVADGMLPNARYRLPEPDMTRMPGVPMPSPFVLPPDAGAARVEPAKGPTVEPPNGVPAGAKPPPSSGEDAHGEPANARSAEPADGAGVAREGFAVLFETCAELILPHVAWRLGIIGVLRTKAREFLATSAERREFIAYAEARFDALSQQEAEEMGFTAMEYDVWRKDYDSAKASSVAKPTADKAADRTDMPADKPNSEGEPQRSSSEAQSPSAMAQAPSKSEATSGAKVAREGDADDDEEASADAAPSEVEGTPPTGAGGWLARAIERAYQAGLTDVRVRRVLVGSIGVLLGLIVSYFVGSALWGYVTGPAAVMIGLLVGTRGFNAKAASKAPSPGAVIACGVALLLIVGMAGLQWARARPGKAAVQEHLATALSPLPVRITNLATSYSSHSGRDGVVAFDAVVETTAPLYRRVDRAPALATFAGAELGAIEGAAALLRGNGGMRLRAAVGELEPTPGLADVVLVTTSTPAGTGVPYAGTLRARRMAKSWWFTAGEERLDRTRLEGEPKPAGSFAVDAPADVERLRGLVAAHVAYAAKVRAASARVAAELERERVARLERWREVLGPGSLFSGMAKQSARPVAHRLVLEITEFAPPSTRISAALRNDGGWGDARQFQGEAVLDPEADRCLVTLHTRAAQRQPDSGPLLDQHGDWTLTLEVRGDGTVVATAPGWDLRVQRVASADAAALRAEMMHPLLDVLAATKPGMVYHGVATSRQTATSERVLLRFTGQDANGTVVEAVLESASQEGWQRRFHGSVIGNTHRAAGTPLRLESGDREGVAQADRRSIFGVPAYNGVTLALRADGRRLEGEEGHFAVKLDLADAAWLARREAERTGRTEQFYAVVKAGAAYDGIARRTSGGLSRLRLRFEDVQRATGAVVVNVESRDHAGVHHQMSGTVDVAAGTLQLASTGVGRTVSGNASTLPLFARAGTYELTLTLAGQAFAGTLARDAWSLTIPVGNGAPGAGGAAANGTPLAEDVAYPAESGAYVWVNREWVPLPRNSARPVQAGAQALSNVFGFVRGVQNVVAGRVPDVKLEPPSVVEFDTRASVPVVPAGPVMIAYVGRLEETAKSEVLAQHPELRNLPAIEMAATTLGRDGHRTASLLRLVPGLVSLGEGRIAGTIEQPQPDVTLLRSTGPMPPGHYAINCGGQVYEVRVE